MKMLNNALSHRERERKSERGRKTVSLCGSAPKVNRVYSGPRPIAHASFMEIPLNVFCVIRLTKPKTNKGTCENLIGRGT